MNVPNFQQISSEAKRCAQAEFCSTLSKRNICIIFGMEFSDAGQMLGDYAKYIYNGCTVRANPSASMYNYTISWWQSVTTTQKKGLKGATNCCTHSLNKTRTTDPADLKWKGSHAVNEAHGNVKQFKWREFNAPPAEWWSLSSLLCCTWNRTGKYLILLQVLQVLCYFRFATPAFGISTSVKS